jgi:glycosyltransferase involved in cell wall biosynthesis
MDRRKELTGLHASGFPPQSFSSQAGLLAEILVENEGIDVIEAQEYEAPLYYFQLRRAVGWGPRRSPPCFVHLHSPTQIIIQHNDGDLNHPYFLTARRLEAYSIGAADALLCPSHYLARQAETRFGLTTGAVQVIPLPIGDNDLLNRDVHTWKHGSICYVGRLERRKGVLEYIDAAVSVAPDYPEATFDFIGANCLATERVGGKQMIQSRIPEEFKSRFRFWGARERSQLSRFLLHARVAVVPSRWENFPNTCVEAMCSGLPVIASPEGGMAEMIRDGRNGWLATNAHPEGLAEALRRALDTSPDTIARMGQNAAADIRRICDNQVTLRRHLEFRSGLIHQTSQRSLHLPANLPWFKTPVHAAPATRCPKESHEDGIAVVVSCFDTLYGIDKCLRSIEYQTHKPLDVVVVVDEWSEKPVLKLLDTSQRNGWRLIRKESGGRVSGKNLGLASALEVAVKPVGLVFLAAEDQIQPQFIEAVGSVLQRCPEIGIVSCWVEDLKYKSVVNTTPCPSFPFQWLSNELVSFSAVRTEALLEAGGFRSFPYAEYENWDLFNAVMAAGWAAVTMPAVLGKEQTTRKYGIGPRASGAHGPMCEQILGRFPELVAQDSHELLLLAISSSAYLMNTELSVMRNRLATREEYLRHPGVVVWKLLRRFKDKLVRKLPGWTVSFPP